MPTGVTAAGVEGEWTGLVRQRVVSRLTAYAAEREAAGLAPEDDRERRRTVDRLLAEELAGQRRNALAGGGRVMDAAVEERTAQAVRDALFGTGGLEGLLADESLENICVNGCDAVWVKDAHGRWRQVAPVAASDEELVEVVRTLAARTGAEERRFDRGVPRVNLQLPDGSRLFAVMAVTGRVSLTIRRHRFPAASMADLVRLGVCDPALAGFLTALIRAQERGRRRRHQRREDHRTSGLRQPDPPAGATGDDRGHLRTRPGHRCGGAPERGGHAGARAEHRGARRH
jgi:hypothetical protein